MLRLDHLAIRCKNRFESAKIWIDIFGYKIQEEFTIDFGDGSCALCIALEPPTKVSAGIPWSILAQVPKSDGIFQDVEYHMMPEIFISDGNGDEDSIVGQWVKKNGNSLHHVAFMTDDINFYMNKLKNSGIEFTTEDPVICDDEHGGKVVQIFTKPLSTCGFIIELIHRNERGFCKNNVLALMQSTAKLAN